MTRARNVELALVAAAPAATSGPAATPASPPDAAPRRMTKRCRRCGKPVPTVSGLVWRARRLAADVEAAARDVFQVRTEPGGADRDELLKRAHQRQLEAGDGAQKLLSDLRKLQAHDRRCREAGPPAGGER